MPLMVRVLAAVVLLFPSVAPAQQAPAQGGSPAQAAGGRGRAPQPLLPFIIVRHDPALDLLIAPDAKLETIITIPGLSGEGPMWRDGRLWFSDQRSGNIYSVSLDGQATVVAKDAGGPADPNSRMARGPNGEAVA